MRRVSTVLDRRPDAGTADSIGDTDTPRTSPDPKCLDGTATNGRRFGKVAVLARGAGHGPSRTWSATKKRSAEQLVAGLAAATR
jgi:hypothetical protein